MTDKPVSSLVTPSISRTVSTRRSAAPIVGQGAPDPEQFGFRDKSSSINNRLRKELEKLGPGLNKHDRRKKRTQEVDPNQWKTDLLDTGRGAKKQAIESPLAQKKACAMKSTPSVVNTEEEIPTAPNNAAQGTKRVSKAPLPMRSIIENDGLAHLITENANCSQCRRKDTLRLSFPSVCVTTIPTLHCVFCEYVKKSEVTFTKFKQEHKEKHQRTLDYATNVLFATAFTACGDGGTEAERFLALMDLPNATTMSHTSFRRIESSLGPACKEIVDEALKENLFIEVQKSMEGIPGFDFEVWKLCYETGEDLPSTCKKAVLKGSMDMGWNNRGGGRRFDSQSGHAFFVGYYTRKAVTFSIKSRYCSFCTFHSSKGDDILDHTCKKNHDRSAGSMEPAALVDMVHHLWDDANCAVGVVITDDDSKMQAQTKWANDDYKKHHNLPSTPIVGWTKPKNPAKNKPQPIKRTSGSLRYPVNPPLFSADPAHRKKSLRNQLYSMKGKGKYGSYGLEEGDILRLTMSFIYMVRQLSSVDESEYENRGKAVLEHHFDNHVFCHDWCKRKKESDEEKAKSAKYYRCKTKNKNLYLALKTILDDFTSREKLLECAHGGDTNVNESLNNTISWFAPKNKTYSGTNSLTIRISMAAAINIVGYDRFFDLLYEKLGIQMGEGTRHALIVHERERRSKLTKEKLAKWKHKRNKKVYNKLIEYHRKLKTDIAMGTQYESGIRMKKAHCGDSTIQKKESSICHVCGKKGHKTKRSKKCLYYGKDVPQTVVERANSTKNIQETSNCEKSESDVLADTVDLLDAIALSTDVDSERTAILASELGEIEDVSLDEEDDE